LDAIINNAAILIKEDLKLSADPQEILEKTIRTNCYGPLEVIKAFLPFLNSPGRIINISSGGGSMSDPVGGWSPAYCVSKSMLNALTRHLAYELKDKKISVNSVCPGWVRTDMGGSAAPRSLEQGAETPVWMVSEADLKITGKFFRDKKEIPW
jgi:NAD(P)-dependent dehydrogenase (short-subunit alcohol dehydrogenase family)